MAKTLDSCPYLGLSFDRAIHTDYPNDDHYCFAREEPATVSASRQRLVCLASVYVHCWRLPDNERKDPSARTLPRIDRGVRLLFAAVAIVIVLAIAVTQWLAFGQTIAPDARGSVPASATATQARPAQTAAPQATAPFTVPAAAQPTTTAPPAPTATTAPPSPTRVVPTATAVPQPATPPAAAGPVYHTVTSGETLLVIANRNGITVDAIMRANGLTNPDTLSVGQKLLIPPSTR